MLPPVKAGVLVAPKPGADAPNPWDNVEPNRLPAELDCPKKLLDPKGDEAPTLLGVFRVLKADPEKPGVLEPKTDVPRGVDPNAFVPNPAALLAPNGDGDAPNVGAMDCPDAGAVDGAAKGDGVWPNCVPPNAGAGVAPNVGVGAPNPVAGFCAPNIPEVGVVANGLGVDDCCWPKPPVAAPPKGLCGVVPKIPPLAGCCPAGFGPPAQKNSIRRLRLQYNGKNAWTISNLMTSNLQFLLYS